MKGNNITGLRVLAQEAARSGDWGASAIEVNTRILELDPHASDAYTRLARCFVEQGKHSAAYEMYKQVLAFDPGNKIARNNLDRIRPQVIHGSCPRKWCKLVTPEVEEAIVLRHSAGLDSEPLRAW